MNNLQRQRGPELQVIFDELRTIREAYESGEVDAEGRSTGFGTLMRASAPVEIQEEED
ncbi:MAG: hypothetical protein ACQEVT_18005 [Pseudomonadota bacterium]